MADFTLDKLANAMRGMSRDARIIVQLPDGGLVDLDYVQPILASDRGGTIADVSQSGSGRYTILLAVASG